MLTKAGGDMADFRVGTGSDDGNVGFDCSVGGLCGEIAHHHPRIGRFAVEAAADKHLELTGSRFIDEDVDRDRDRARFVDVDSRRKQGGNVYGQLHGNDLSLNGRYGPIPSLSNRA